MTTLKERVENHPAVFFLAAIVAGFGTFPAILSIAGRTYVSTDHLQALEAAAGEQHWLRIRGVDGLNGFRGRVVARVDGMAVSYPSRVVYAELDRSMPPEEFALPGGRREYMVSFELLAVEPDGSFRTFTSQEVLRVTPPFEGEYSLLPVTQSQWLGNSRGAPATSPGARISFGVR